MPVNQINTPNLAVELAVIDGIKSTIASNAPTTFDTIINSCWKLKPTQDCGAFILEDFTDYQELEAVDLNELTISTYLEFCGHCENTSPCPAIFIQPNVKTSFADDWVDKDGIYCAVIQITYNRDELGTLVPYTKTIRQSYRKDCCEKEYKNISRDVWGKMSDIACNIRSLAKVGRNTKVLKKSYLKLSNLLYLYYNSADACFEKDQVLCMYNKIK